MFNRLATSVIKLKDYEEEAQRKLDEDTGNTGNKNTTSVDVKVSKEVYVQRLLHGAAQFEFDEFISKFKFRWCSIPLRHLCLTLS